MAMNTLRTPGMDMEKTCKDWLRAGSRAGNARQMYRLAEDVVTSGSASPRQKREARRVVKILSGVIDKPIAEAALLKAARRRFDGLVAVLQERPPCPRPLLAAQLLSRIDEYAEK